MKDKIVIAIAVMAAFIIAFVGETYINSIMGN
jgi:hypothetical protein